MPQLDLAIFHYHIICFTIFFLFIYIYIRASFIPNLSALVKYRKKLVNYFIVQKNFFLNKFISFNSFLEVKIIAILNLYLKFILKYFFWTNSILSFWIIFFNKVFFLRKKNSLLNFYGMNWYLANNYVSF
jgi:hypothetical protein